MCLCATWRVSWNRRVWFLLSIEDMSTTHWPKWLIQNQRQFFQVLNDVPPSLSFAMEFEHDGSILILGMVILSSGNKLTTKVYRKPNDNGLLLNFQSHVDNKCKRGLVNTMVDRAYRLSSTKEAFSTEWDKLRTMFSKLRYLKDMVDSTIHRFSQEQRERHATHQNPLVYIILKTNTSWQFENI